MYPHAAAFGALDDAEVAVEEFARAGAREALACGVHVTFGPVADVNRNPDNPIISTRAFGDDPERVAALVEAYIRGCRSEGLLSTAKHFPGHGNTTEDSHAVLPTVSDSRAVLEETDFVPFRAAIEAGCELIMTAHVAYPALDPSGKPATLSAPILQALLRDEFGFEGVVISDSLHMGGILASGQTEVELAIEQVRAGVDLLLDAQDPAAIIEGLADAVQRGDLDEAVLDRALARAERLRTQLTDRYGDDLFTEPAEAVGAAEVGAEAHAWLAIRSAREAVTGDDVRFDTGEGVLAVLVKPPASHLDPPEQPLGAALRAALPGVTYREVGPGTDAHARAAIVDEAQAAERVLVALVVKPAAWHAFGLPPEQQDFVEALVRGERTVVASLGSPRILDRFGEAAARLCTFSDAPVAQQALADVLAGKQ